MSPKGPPFIFFLFCKRMDVEKQPKGPFYIFRYNATYQKLQKKFKKFLEVFLGTVEESTWHFEVLSLFLSLRYGADLGRSRLVFFS